VSVADGVATWQEALFIRPVAPGGPGCLCGARGPINVDAGALGVEGGGQTERRALRGMHLWPWCERKSCVSWRWSCGLRQLVVGVGVRLMFESAQFRRRRASRSRVRIWRSIATVAILRPPRSAMR
jgi:hypothetical protein